MRSAIAALLLAWLACACGDVASVAVTNPMDQEPVDSCPADPSWSQDLPEYPRGLHVEGTQLVDSNGSAIALRGVNRSGTEYRCIQGFGLFDGPDTEESVQAIASWNVNAVRVPLNEACWLGIQDVQPEYGGCNYKNAIRRYVALLHKYALVPILDLHWAAPNVTRAVRLQPLPNVENSPAFWSDVAKTFKDDDGVVFEPYNEPFPAQNTDSPWAWHCWRDGCKEDLALPAGEPALEYQAAGMQSLVSAIRDAKASNLILLGGVQYSNALSQWLANKPDDPLGNLAAAWHVYNYNSCVSEDCWNGAARAVSEAVPLVATEIGEDDCDGGFISPLMQWLEQHGDGYLAWSWNAYGPCRAKGSGQRGSPYSLIASYTTGAPNGPYAQAFFDHLQASP